MSLSSTPDTVSGHPGRTVPQQADGHSGPLGPVSGCPPVHRETVRGGGKRYPHPLQVVLEYMVAAFEAEMTRLDGQGDRERLDALRTTPRRPRAQAAHDEDEATA
jgi:hypothetical protein